MDNPRIEGVKNNTIQIPAFVNQRGEAATRAYKARMAEIRKKNEKRKKVSKFGDNVVCWMLVAFVVLMAGIGIGTCMRQVVGEVWLQSPVSTRVAIVYSIGTTLFLLVCNMIGNKEEEEK